MSDNTELLSRTKASLRVHESFSARAVADPSADPSDLVIGYGHNITARPLTHIQGELIMDLDLHDDLNTLERQSWWTSLSVERQSVILEMAYQLGTGGLFKFVRMITAVSAGMHDIAIREMGDSDWARKQTPGRAHELIERYRKG